MVVQFARQMLALLFLRVDGPLRQLAHLRLRSVRAPLEKAEAQNYDERDTESEQHGLPPEAIEIAPKGGVALCHFGTLFGKIRVVQFLDLLRDPQHRVAARDDVAPEEARALDDLLRR